MSSEAILIISGGLAFGIANAVFIRWSRWRLERENSRERPAE